jgi:DNA-directed RNA polymerase specialized sigma24 family protein
LPISSYSDDELLSAIRLDDEKAFEELFERYWKHVHTMTYHMVLSMDATQEIVQNVFVSLWDQRATLSISPLPLYLNAITKNCVLNYMDPQLTHRRRCDYSQPFIAQQSHVADHDVRVNEFMDAHECGMNHRPEKSKKIFRFHQLEKLSIAEIARRLISLKWLFNSISHDQQKG